MFFPIILAVLFSSINQDQHSVNYYIGTVEEVSHMAFSLNDGTVWRFSQIPPKMPHDQVVIIGGTVSNSAMVYYEGYSYPATLMDGTPRYQFGFLTSLIIANKEKRTLFLTDGTTRRVTDEAYEFNFKADTIYTLIISQDRRFAINLYNHDLIPISPPLRN